MRDLNELTRYKKWHPAGGWGDKDGGYYEVRSPLQTSQNLSIIASTGEGWDHVSVSLPRRIPTWIEMDYIRSLFFKDDEVVMQLHPEESKHINVMENCLHLWRPQKESIPLPPEWMV